VEGESRGCRAGGGGERPADEDGARRTAAEWQGPICAVGGVCFADSAVRGQRECWHCAGHGLGMSKRAVFFRPSVVSLLLPIPIVASWYLGLRVPLHCLYLHHLRPFPVKATSCLRSVRALPTTGRCFVILAFSHAPNVLTSSASSSQPPSLIRLLRDLHCYSPAPHTRRCSQHEFLSRALLAQNKTE
jgi:hypothetical protein